MFRLSAFRPVAVLAAAVLLVPLPAAALQDPPAGPADRQAALLAAAGHGIPFDPSLPRWIVSDDGLTGCWNLPYGRSCALLRALPDACPSPTAHVSALYALVLGVAVVTGIGAAAAFASHTVPAQLPFFGAIAGGGLGANLAGPLYCG